MKRMKTRDMMTFDAAGKQVIDQAGTERGRLLGTNFQTHDGRTVDSTGAFLVGELERLDLTLHKPLAAVTWGRDIDLRDDVTIADDVSSFTVSSFASAGGLGDGQAVGNGKSWIGRKSNQVPGTSIDIAKIANPLTPWGNELAYTLFELESAAKLGRPIDQQKFEALQLKHQMDIDEQVYIGDTSLGLYGLVNNPLVAQYGTQTSLPDGISGFSQWTKKTPDEILADVNEMLVSTWTASGWAVISDKILLPPAQYGYIATQKVSNAGNVSILKYILENNLFTRSEGKELDIKPVKWLVGAGAGGTLGVAGTVDRAVVYKQERDRVRFPMTLLNRTPVQYDSIFHKTTYFCKLGAVEIVYPELLGYFDGL
jgi:hypothetical protein